MGFLAGNWQKCLGMNKDGKCRAGVRHLGHKKSWGVWYGQVAKNPKDQPKLPDGRKKKR